MALEYACTRLIEAEDLKCCEASQVDPALLDEALDTASDFVVFVTGRDYGRCQRTFRVCGPCNCGHDPCDCCAPRGLTLPGFRPHVVEVRINDEPVDPLTYVAILNHYGAMILERFRSDGKVIDWPACDVEVDLISGWEVNSMVRHAAAEIACDVIANDAGRETYMPDGVIAANAYNVQMETRRFGDPSINAGEFDGLPWLRRLLGTIQPESAIDVWSPEVDSGTQWNQKVTTAP